MTPPDHPCGPGAFSEQGGFSEQLRTDPARMTVLFSRRSGSIFLTAASVFPNSCSCAFFRTDSSGFFQKHIPVQKKTVS
jgi:hypothetical protein